MDGRVIFGGNDAIFPLCRHGEKSIAKTPGQRLVLNPELWRLYGDKKLVDPRPIFW
jgi:hypothetical protein